ncbi:unnamed protein product [Didymodactylos carnosus]|uniref:Peptidase S1 domain-containing protein n=1 Tax=Didymodactylos carnosus TaxID=1234261 RepID=A0A815HXH6_9BILA|nr:unnamed protein product [Didymodactylos carnosus]CAF4230296.1 unnamed protein product [Didymodactylos carnosus]
MSSPFSLDMAHPERACALDFGAPLMQYSQVSKTWSLIGLVSNVSSCGGAGKPGVYTRVASYITWIRKHISQATRQPLRRLLRQQPQKQLQQPLQQPQQLLQRLPQRLPQQPLRRQS